MPVRITEIIKKRERIITIDGILFSWEEKGDFRYSKPVNLPDGLTGISATIIRNIWEPVVRGERELVNTYRAEVILMPPVPENQEFIIRFPLPSRS